MYRFPAIEQKVCGNKPLTYLDSAATTQKPLSVIQAIQHYYARDNANVHRAVHCLSDRATKQFDETRQKVQRLIKAKKDTEIIFTSGTTDALNLVAQSYLRPRLKKGDRIIVSIMEHHSNLVPWQQLAKAVGAELVFVPADNKGEIKLDALKSSLTSSTKLVAVSHVSNVLGTINPIKEITEIAHKKNIPVVVDGAQAAGHICVDIADLDCDFYAFSGHKMYGPTGIGVLYGKQELLEQMQPIKFGGEMIKSVTTKETRFADVPRRFEAGTPNIAGVIGLGAAIDFINRVSIKKLVQHDRDIMSYAKKKIDDLGFVKILGDPAQRSGLMSLYVDEVHPHDVATVLDSRGIAIRAGHMCAQPLIDSYRLPAVSRVSFAFYNTRDDVDRLVEGLKEIKQTFLS